MKKNLFAVAGLALAGMFMTGCAMVGTNNGSVVLGGGGVFSEMSANAVIPQYAPKNYTIVKRDVTATATLAGFFSIINMGDASYATLKAAALQQAPGATDLTNVKIDYRQECIIGINKVKVTLTADAIKY